MNVLDSWISFGRSFQRIIDCGTKLDNVDALLVAGTGNPDFFWLASNFPFLVSFRFIYLFFRRSRAEAQCLDVLEKA